MNVWEGVRPKAYGIHTPEFYQAYADNEALRRIVLPAPYQPLHIELYRAGTDTPRVGCCAFLGPCGVEKVKRDWESYYDRVWSADDLKGHLMERRSEKGKSWFEAYVPRVIDICQRYSTAVVFSRNIVEALAPMLPDSAWVYYSVENPRLIGQGACTRYMLSKEWSLFYGDIDTTPEWLERNYRAVTSRVKGDVGMVRTVAAAGVDRFYRGVLGSRLWIEKIEDFDVEEVCTGHIVCNLAHSHADTTFAFESASKPDMPWFGDKYPAYCYDEYLLHTVFMTHFARKGRLHTMVTAPEGIVRDEAMSDVRHLADMEFCARQPGNSKEYWDWNPDKHARSCTRDKRAGEILPARTGQVSCLQRDLS